VRIRCALPGMAAVLVTLAACAGSNTESASSAALAVRVVTVQTGAYVKQVQAVGRVGAAAGSESKLSFAESGILQDVYVQIGEHVGAGQALAQLDTSGLSLSAAQAQADAQAAQANLQQARIDRISAKLQTDRSELRRQQSLYAAGVAAYKDVQAARAQLAADEADAATASTQVSGASAQTQSARDRALLAQRDLYNGTLRAPVAGIVTAIYKRPGEAVDTTTPVVAIGPLATGEVTLDVSAADAAQIRSGDSVEFSVPGTGLHASGRIDGVSSAVDPATQTATVTASGVPSGAPSGSAVQASIDVAHERGIVVPQSAIVQDPQSGATLVFVQTRDKNGKMAFAERTVTIADQNGVQVLIGSGLHRGERIAAQGGFALLAPAGSNNGD
jgi:RND family efflux transporter MFP subunit